MQKDKRIQNLAVMQTGGYLLSQKSMLLLQKVKYMQLFIDSPMGSVQHKTESDYRKMNGLTLLLIYIVFG